MAKLTVTPTIPATNIFEMIYEISKVSVTNHTPNVFSERLRQMAKAYRKAWWCHRPFRWLKTHRRHMVKLTTPPAVAPMAVEATYHSAIISVRKTVTPKSTAVAVMEATCDRNHEAIKGVFPLFAFVEMA